MPYRLLIREIAQQKGFDQSKLARRADIAFKTVQKLWHHPQVDVQLSTLERLAQALEVRLTELIDDTPASS